MESQDSTTAVRHNHEQMLKLVAKGFYNELIKYGVNKPEIVTVAGHLLDNLLHQGERPNKESEYYNALFRINDIQDEWSKKKRLTVQQVSLAPLDSSLTSAIAGWLRDPLVRESFVPAFPTSQKELEEYFRNPTRQYFGIFHEDEPTGIIGAENIDRETSKLEMRKLVGNTAMRGKGIGKQATFVFLYYVFEILKFQKVYLHSTDINIRNLNLNNKFGFELEGVFFDDAVVQGKKVDLVRMGLRVSVWRELFS
jgi:RimJ/RimL family protein N-acetyltransferase